MNDVEVQDTFQADASHKFPDHPRLTAAILSAFEESLGILSILVIFEILGILQIMVILVIFEIGGILQIMAILVIFGDFEESLGKKEEIATSAGHHDGRAYSTVVCRTRLPAGKKCMFLKTVSVPGT